MDFSGTGAPTTASPASPAPSRERSGVGPGSLGCGSRTMSSEGRVLRCAVYTRIIDVVHRGSDGGILRKTLRDGGVQCARRKTIDRCCRRKLLDLISDDAAIVGPCLRSRPR